MKKYRIVFLLALLCLYQTAKAQVTGEVNVLDRDMFYFHYTPPNVISDDFEYQRFSGKLSLPPIRIGQLSLFNTFGLDVHRFNYKDDSIGESSSALDQFYNINYSLVAAYRLSDKWSINAIVSPFITSNLEEDLSSDDVGINGNLFAEYTLMRRRGGYFKFGAGVTYVTFNGTPQLVPLTHIKARLNEQWSFVLGIPNTYVKWDINNKHSIKVLADLNDFSANLSGPTAVSQLDQADRAVFTVVSAGAEYNYWVTPSVGILFRVTQAVWNDYELRDADDQSLHDFDADFKQPFVSIGIKFNPIRKIQNSLRPF
ncbi:MAG: DUF6268 family outer membrane beta-barrel protein [Bacteroidota bacterium]